MAKQLSLPERYVIERMLHQDYSFASIGRNLDRSASTIAREVLHYRCFTSRSPIMGENDCINRPSCQRNTLCPEMVVLHPDASVVLKESFVHLKRLFGVILTDNGVEFKNPNALEHTRPGLIRTHVFFCDPQASWQTPHVENNHRLIRRIIPKGTSLNKLNVEDTRLVCCHINSVIRDNLDGKTPFDLMDSADEKKLLSALNLSPIPPDEVILSPKLIKH